MGSGIFLPLTRLLRLCNDVLTYIVGVGATVWFDWIDKYFSSTHSYPPTWTSRTILRKKFRINSLSSNDINLLERLARYWIYPCCGISGLWIWVCMHAWTYVRTYAHMHVHLPNCRWKSSLSWPEDTLFPTIQNILKFFNGCMLTAPSSQLTAP
jgi:hypothetical protein